MANFHNSLLGFDNVIHVQVQDSRNYFIVEHQQIFMFIWNQLTNGVQMHIPYINTYLFARSSTNSHKYLHILRQTSFLRSNNGMNVWFKIGPILFWFFISNDLSPPFQTWKRSFQKYYCIVLAVFFWEC